MAQTSDLLNTLKKLLKRNNCTYAQVAEHLQLSEASVKRLFSEQNISLQRLDAICHLIGLEISELVQEMQTEYRKPISELTEAQEKEIAHDLILLMITVYVLNRWSMQDILTHYQLTEAECIRYLVHLDRLRIIELLPNNQIKLLVAANFKWRDDGPIMNLFRSKIESEYFRTRFTKDSENLIVLNGMLSDANNALFQRKMAQLAREFDTLSKEDADLPIGKRKGATLLIGLRDWNYEQLFGQNRRSSK